ncbi:MAG: hypothetical protein LQ349_000630 [Xanthoria aureola]|nr:MAG: hypothetical protein LQ349_000630 [Xanthoria aureola]
MDGSGSEVSKRPRLGPYDAPHSHRMQPQLPISQSHGYIAGHTLPPPNPSPVSVTYAHPHQQSAVQSPYNDYESRNLPVPEPTPHQYVQAAHSGHSTPLRDQRPYPSEPSSYSRRGSASGPNRSPDDYVYSSGRPLSIATTSESQHYPPQHYPVDHGGGQPYHPHDAPNGTSNHGLPMPQYNESAHGPPSAHPHDYSQSPVSGHPHPYGPSALGAQAQAQYQNMQREKIRSKGHRAQQACDACRTRKSKCDEQRPMCSNCRENNQECKYQHIQPAKADRANQQILDKLADLSNIMQVTNKRLDGMEKAMADTQRKPSPDLSSTDTTEIKTITPYSTKQESPSVGLAEQVNRHFVRPAIPKFKENETTELTPMDPAITINPESIGPHAVVSEDGRHVAISIEHATAAHRLLHWPSIHDIVHRSKVIRQISLGPDYVMTMEQEKGVLRLYGWGAGREPTTDAHGSPPGANPQGGNSPSSSASNRSDEAASPASDGLWGTGSAPATNSERQALGNPGGLTSENLLDIHPRTMRRLLNSYHENFHILHPFLERSRLNRMFERFSMRYNKADQALTKTLFAGPVSNLALDALKDGSNGAQRTAKRKYSSGHYTASGDSSAVLLQNSSDIRLEHNMSTAIVLLVMALGRIAEWKEPLPGPVSIPGDHPDGSTAPRPLYSPTRMQVNSRSPPAGMEQSPNSSTYAGTNPSIPSLLSGPRTQTSSPRLVPEDTSGPRNVDVIPGLAYYAKATDILGNLFGLNDLTQVQAHLLAGLFAGQLARTFESWSWIHSACIACRFIVRESSMKDAKESRKDLIKFAFWTCSQLESDILAELDLPRSGIQNITLDYPKGFMDDFEKANMPDSAIPNQTMMWYYSGQIHIRNMLNDIQSELYPPQDKERAVRGTALRDHFHHRLKAWRDLLPIGLQWSDEDPPSSDINTARLRAKYYGALNIIHRPFLRHALDHNMDFQDSPPAQVHAAISYQAGSASYSPQSMERKNSSMGPPGSTQKEKIHQAEILHSAKTCVAAAIQSTEAFDNIINRQRLIVTNIFGTAHAQFGNMLVLATTYKSPLAFLISKVTLERLFHRTINFLRSLEAVSETLGRDALILEKLQEVVFDDGHLSHSFSSDMS